MNKIIIHNYTNLEDADTLKYIEFVIDKGKISKTKQGEQYCFATVFESGYAVTSNRNGNTYTFRITKE